MRVCVTPPNLPPQGIRETRVGAQQDGARSCGVHASIQKGHGLHQRREELDITRRGVASRDALGNPTAIDGRTRSPAGQLNEDFAYDADFHVLTEAKVDTYGTLSPYREYDYTVQQSLLGDRSTAVEKTDGSGGTLDWTHEYVGGASRLARLLLAEGTDEYKFEMTHDAGGRLGRIDYYAKVDGQWVSEAYETFGYDEAGRRNAFLLEHGKQGASVYDWADLRTRLVEGVNQAKTDFWYERSGELVAELGCATSTCEWGTGSLPDGGSPTPPWRPLQEYVWLAGEPLALVTSNLLPTGDADDTPGEVRWFHNGLLGEPRIVTDGSRNTDWELNLRPFGRDKNNDPSTPPSGFSMNLGLPGQYWGENEHREMHYNWHRNYMAVSGRYVEADPLLRGPRLDGLSPYAYGLGVPLVFIDPLGLRVIVTMGNTGYAEVGYSPGPGGSAGVTLFTAYGIRTDPCACRGKNSWGFNLHVTYDIVTQYRRGTWSAPSADEPGLTLGQHEENHRRDLFAGVAPQVIESTIQTEGFTTKAECSAALRTARTRLNEYNDALYDRTTSRDAP